MKKIKNWVLQLFGWETLAIALIKMARSLFTEMITNSDPLSKKQKMFVQWIDAGNRTLIKKFSQETPTQIDDETQKQIEEMAHEISSHHNFNLHIISEV